MNTDIIAVNGRRVSKVIGTNVEDECNLINNTNNKEIAEFLKKYNKYLYSNKIEDIKQFYNITGLMLTHIYNVEDGKKIIYSMNSILRTDINSNAFKKPVYTTHILVVSYYSDNNSRQYYSEIFWKNQREEMIGNDIRYTMSCVCKNIKSKISYIEERYYPKVFESFDKKDIKQIELTVLNNLCVLLNDGTLYLDNKIYATNVDTIWHQDSYNSYIIYKDNKIEELVSQFPYSSIKKYKKILYNSYVLAILNKKTLNLTILVDKPDTCIMTSILGVNDIECTKEMLYIKVGDEKIRIPSWYNTIVVDNRNLY